jgi:hypothetical protein
MYPNVLALFDTILNRVDHPGDESRIESHLVELAQELDISMDVIEDALYCDRSLVVYEP